MYSVQCVHAYMCTVKQSQSAGRSREVKTCDSDNAADSDEVVIAAVLQ